jgi:hypothetical protein
MWFPSSLSVNTSYDLSRTCFFFPLLLSCIEERYLSINYICKLEYYYVLQVNWELAVFGVAKIGARVHDVIVLRSTKSGGESLSIFLLQQRILLARYAIFTF